MATELKLRRGTTVQHSTFTGGEGEVTVDTTKDTLVVHDGSTAGGIPLAKESELASKLDASQYTASDVLTKLKTVDGSGSGLDADLLDGQSSAYFRINIYDAAGTLLN